MTLVAIAAGGTGGHIVPGVAVARALLEDGVSVAWFGSGGPVEERLLGDLDCARYATTVVSPRGGLRGLLRSSRVMAVALRRTLSVLRQQRPQVLLGMGGFASWPGGLAARLLRIPLVLHEQNAVAGLANRMLAPLASGVCTGFPGVLSERGEPRALFTGNPVPDAVCRSTRTEPVNRDDGRLRILVLGGSQGAEALNRTVPPALALAAAAGLQLDIVHQCGSAAGQRVTADYARYAVAAQVVPFIDDMAGAYAGCDLVIARAGALTIAELCVAGRPAVLVPYPHATDNHQAANAAYLAVHDAALVVPQVEMNEGGLAELVAELASRERRAALARNARALARPDAARMVAARCLELAGHA